MSQTPVVQEARLARFQVTNSLGVNGNSVPMFPQAFSGIGFLDFPLLRVINWFKQTAFCNH